MKCISCQIEINPQWKHAIDQNMCPFCGQVIMEEKLKELLSTLAATMESLKDYEDQLNDWMLSNYHYIKTTSKEFAKYLPKQNKKSEVKEEATVENESVGEEYIVNVQTEEGVEPVVAKKIQSEERTNLFFKRAEVKTKGEGYGTTAEKTKHIKSLVQQIREGGSQSIDSSGAASFLSPEMMDQADPEAVKELQAMIEGGSDSIASSLPELANGDDDIPAAVLAMSARASTGSNKDARDLARLQQQVDKSQRSGSGGSFSRSGG